MAIQSLTDRIAERTAQADPGTGDGEVLVDEQPADAVKNVDGESHKLTEEEITLLVKQFDDDSASVVKALFVNMSDEEARQALFDLYTHKGEFETDEQKSNLLASVKELLRHDPRYVQVVQGDLTSEQAEFLEHKSLTAAAHRFLQGGLFQPLVYKVASDRPKVDPATPVEAEEPVAEAPDEPKIFDHELEGLDDDDLAPDAVDPDQISAGDVARQLGISWPDVLNLMHLEQGDPSTMVSRAAVTTAFEAKRRLAAVEAEVQAPVDVVAPPEPVDTPVVDEPVDTLDVDEPVVEVIDVPDEATPDDSGPSGADDDEVVVVEHVEPIDISEEFLAEFVASADACLEILSSI